MADRVIEELWRIKEAMAQEHGYDIARLAADLETKQEGEEGHRIVNLHVVRKGGSREVPARGGS